jgi:GxxExxY protein
MNASDDSASELKAKLKDFAKEIYGDLGSGHPEKIYEQALLVCLRGAGLKYEHQKVVEVTFRGHYVGEGFADIVVRYSDISCLVVEVKAVPSKLGLPEQTQIRKYMSKLNAKHGLLINFPQPDRKKESQNRGVEFVEINLDYEQ